MTTIAVIIYLAELASATFITDAILRRHGLPRLFGFHWLCIIGPVYGVYALLHPWGLPIVGLIGAFWGFYRLLRPCTTNDA